MSQKAGLGMIGIAWILLFGVATLAIHDWLAQEQNPNRQLASAYGDGGQRRVVLAANRQHHYVADIQIDGHSVTVLVDTGATDVVIPEALAQRLTLPVGPTGYAMTANGRIRVTRTVIDEIIIGNIVLRQIKAVINPAMSASDPVLLGMSALKNVELRQRDGELLLIQSPLAAN